MSRRGDAEVAVGAGELVTEFANFFGLLGDALVGELEAALQVCWSRQEANSARFLRVKPAPS
jgi:hypothetical protein